MSGWTVEVLMSRKAREQKFWRLITRERVRLRRLQSETCERREASSDGDSTTLTDDERREQRRAQEEQWKQRASNTPTFISDLKRAHLAFRNTAQLLKPQPRTFLSAQSHCPSTTPLLPVSVRTPVRCSPPLPHPRLLSAVAALSLCCIRLFPHVALLRQLHRRAVGSCRFSHRQQPHSAAHRRARCTHQAARGASEASAERALRGAHRPDERSDRGGRGETG